MVKIFDAFWRWNFLQGNHEDRVRCCWWGLWYFCIDSQLCHSVSYSTSRNRRKNVVQNFCKVAREDGDQLSMEAKSKCPYFMATIHEILRMSCVAPTGLLHLTKRESSIQGYAIPKDTIVIANLRQINFDSQEWSETSPVFAPNASLTPTGIRR